MSYLVANPEDKFSGDEAQIFLVHTLAYLLYIVKVWWDGSNSSRNCRH